MAISFTERLAMMEAHSAKIGKRKCACKGCKRVGFYLCQGGCGRAYCGHHARGRVDIAEMRAAEELRGTCVCLNCLPTRVIRGG